MIFKQYTLNGKRRVSNGKRHVIQRKQTRENVCGLCLNANSCTRAIRVARGNDVHFEKRGTQNNLKFPRVNHLIKSRYFLTSRSEIFG